MRFFCAIAVLCLAGALWAQPQSRQYTTYGYDVNGRRVAAGTVSEGRTDARSNSVDRIQSLNGRTVPTETVEETVLSEGPNGRVVERMVQRYDQQGRLAEKERVRIEEERNPGGELVVTESVYRTDLNGSFALQERSTTRTTTAGAATNTTTEMQRLGLSGSFQVVERQTSVERAHENGRTRTASTWRVDASGRLTEQERAATELRTTEGGETETTTIYSAVRGEMEFVEQVVTTTETRTDGSEVSEVSVYGAAATGRSITGSGGDAVLKEQQLIEREPGPDGSMIERVHFRSASLSDAGGMEPYRLITEVICTGQCQEQESVPEAGQAEDEPQQDSGM